MLSLPVIICYSKQQSVHPVPSLFFFLLSVQCRSVIWRTKLIKRDKWKYALIIAFGCVCRDVFLYWTYKLFFFYLSQSSIFENRTDVYLSFNSYINQLLWKRPRIKNESFSFSFMIRSINQYIYMPRERETIEPSDELIFFSPSLALMFEHMYFFLSW